MMLTPRGYLFFCARTTKKVPSLVYYNDRLFLSSISNDPGRETRLVQGCSFPMPMNNVAMPTARLLPPLPVGNSSFERLREDKQLYVDKTDLIYQLASRSEKFFLTRPRRFGKSLLVSTFASLFSHGLRYFSGLAIEKLWHDKIYHVVRIDFSEIKDFKTAAEFACQFYDKLQWWFRPAGFRYDATLPGDVITQLSAWIKTLPVSSLVILRPGCEGAQPYSRRRPQSATRQLRRLLFRRTSVYTRLQPVVRSALFQLARRRFQQLLDDERRQTQRPAEIPSLAFAAVAG